MGLRLHLGRRLAATGDLDAALAQFQKSATDPRVGAEARFQMARCFHQKGFLDLASREFERVLAALPEGHPRAKEILYDLGSISEATGDSDGARTRYSRIYEIDIGYRDVAEKMERLR
jgi:tetratricopeptide (TPR) repeat protein